MDLKVTTEVLKTRAQDAEQKISTVQNSFQSIESMISRSRSYWIGEAGDKHRETYDKEKESIDEILKRLKEHPKDLLTMAGVYEATEKETEAISNSLPVDVIE